jgi:hypothetical protein
MFELILRVDSLFLSTVLIEVYFLTDGKTNSFLTEEVRDDTLSLFYEPKISCLYARSFPILGRSPIPSYFTSSADSLFYLPLYLTGLAGSEFKI